MPLLNENFLKLKSGYLFPEIARRVKEFESTNPSARVIRMGLGDVTQPLPQAVTEAMHRAVDEMSRTESFRGYGPPQGYEFLREAIAKNDFQSRGCDIAADEIFISDGAKSDLGNILDLFDRDNVVAIPDPVYPVYVDSNLMAGTKLVFLPATEANGFVPQIPQERVDVVYLCSPNNPTGAVMSRDQLARWVEYAHDSGAVIFFDAAYEGYITDPATPHSIFQIPGARDCAIEFRSFSKLAGFTGVRVGFTVVPKSLRVRTRSGEQVELHRHWLRRHTTKFQGISYIISRGAEAVFSPSGKEQCRKLVDYYLANARLMRESLMALGLHCFGGKQAPYVWLKTPSSRKSWDYFDLLLKQAQTVCTPGLGFGSLGEGYVRLSAFSSRENTEEAMRRIGEITASG
jgi:LL-diaminopimelate aminotransferase